jgi:hypothetical protein
MTTTHHQRLHDKTGSLARTSNIMTISPPSETVDGKGIDAQPKPPTAGGAKIQVNIGMKDRERMTSTYQAESVECDWQTVFWRLPTPQPSSNHTVPSSAEGSVSAQTLAVGPKSSFSGLESHLAEDEAVTLGEKLAGEMIWGKNEDYKFSELHLVSLLLCVKLMLGCQREDQSSG